MLQGVGGVVQYPKGFMKKAYELVRSNGGVCIADEVRVLYCLNKSRPTGWSDLFPKI